MASERIISISRTIIYSGPESWVDHVIEQSMSDGIHEMGRQQIGGLAIPCTLGVSTSKREVVTLSSDLQAKLEELKNG